MGAEASISSNVLARDRSSTSKASSGLFCSTSRIRVAGKILSVFCAKTRPNLSRSSETRQLVIEHIDGFAIQARRLVLMLLFIEDSG